MCSAYCWREAIYSITSSPGGHPFGYKVVERAGEGGDDGGVRVHGSFGRESASTCFALASSGLNGVLLPCAAGVGVLKQLSSLRARGDTMS